MAIQFPPHLMNSRAIIVLIAVFILSIWLGVSVVTDQRDTLLKVTAVGGLLVCIMLGRRIWLLFIFLNALNMNLIRGFTTSELGQVTLVGFTLLLLLMRRQPLNFKFTELEFWYLLLAIMLAQVYLRHPAGLNMFGAEVMGAKPYLLVGFAFGSSLVLGNIVVPAKEIKWSMGLTIVGWFTSPVLGKLRGGFGGGGGGHFDAREFETRGAATRDGTLGNLALAGSKTLAAFVSPLRHCFHPIWAPLMLLTILLAAASGFRNNVAAVGMFYLIAIAYRGGARSVVLSGALGVMFLGLLAVINIVNPLPANIQRALSPFPGTWEKRYVEDAEGSTEWRTEMWEQALLTDFWIKNKWIGDGMGMSRREHDFLTSLNQRTGHSETLGSGLSADQESQMITGGYHSGPIESIRIMGYIGLLIIVLAMIRTAVHAHRQIMRCRGTEWYSVALFYGIPIISLPFMFVFIFGTFGRDISFLLISIGMMRLLEKNLPLPPWQKTEREPHAPMAHRNLNSVQQVEG